jgi:uncharacterized protein YjbI with pentapeptide repeats
VRLELQPLATLDGADLERVRLEGCALGAQRGRRMRLEAARVTRCGFAGSKVTELAWMDVACERSDLSLVEWPRARLTRVVVSDCRATGARWVEGELEDVRFVACQLECAVFTGARLRRVTFEKCRLRDADFGGADLAGTVFDACELHGVDLTGAKLAGADVHTSELVEARLEPRDMKGLVVSREQAVALATLMGAVVKEE